MSDLKYNKYIETKIWKNFEKQSDKKTLGKISHIIDETIPLLKDIKRVFPTYTNHDAEHSLKIIELIEMLLGNNIKKLSCSESAVILLSSFFHDLGMICNDNEEIKDEIWFKDFIQTQSNFDRNFSNELVSTYIRVNHHLRLEKYLYDEKIILKKDEKSLFIENNEIIDIAFKVAISHNYNTHELVEFTKFSSNGSNDDFVFCAILLRLADIMDFDNERTPNSSFKFLGLENPTNDAEAFSQKEWKKHIQSFGFTY